MTWSCPGQMANLVLVQDVAFESIERDAEQVQVDVQDGHAQVSRAVRLARAARKKRSVVQGASDAHNETRRRN